MDAACTGRAAPAPTAEREAPNGKPPLDGDRAAGSPPVPGAERSDAGGAEARGIVSRIARRTPEPRRAPGCAGEPMPAPTGASGSGKGGGSAGSSTFRITREASRSVIESSSSGLRCRLGCAGHGWTAPSSSTGPTRNISTTARKPQSSPNSAWITRPASKKIWPLEPRATTRKPWRPGSRVQRRTSSETSRTREASASNERPEGRSAGAPAPAPPWASNGLRAILVILCFVLRDRRVLLLRIETVRERRRRAAPLRRTWVVQEYSGRPRHPRRHTTSTSETAPRSPPREPRSDKRHLHRESCSSGDGLGRDGRCPPGRMTAAAKALGQSRRGRQSSAGWRCFTPGA